MSVSVALCCYNGAPWLQDQLESILAQTRLPDEMIVCDDGSADGSAEIVERFAARAPFPLRLTRRPAPVGATLNFDDAIRQCHGELIALCDQDDVWRPRKLELLEQALLQNPAGGYAFCDADLVDASLRPLHRRLRQVLGPTADEQRLLCDGQGAEVLARRNVVSGAMMMFRASYRELLCPLPPGWVHDAWCALLLTAVSQPLLLDEPLVAYRQHERQQIGARRNGLLAQWRTACRMEHGYFSEDVARWEAACARLQQHRQKLRTPRFLQVAQQRLEHARARALMRQQPRRRWPLWARELRSGGYRRYALGWKSALQDALLP